MKKIKIEDIVSTNYYGISFIKNNNNIILVPPVVKKENYPIKGYYNEKKSTTVLVFDDGTKVKVHADNPKRKKAHNGVIIALAKKILGTRSSLNRLYKKFRTDAQAEAALYGVVLSYFITNNIVKDFDTFNLWLAEFVANFLTVQ